MKRPTLILVSGIPATGKTTLAKKISSHFKLPFFSADVIKEIVSDRICGRENEELFTKIANASFEVFYKLIENTIATGVSCVAEALFIIEFSEAKIKKIHDRYGCQIVQLYLSCSEEKATERYDKRHLSGQRHPSHIPTMAEGLKKYGGYANLVKISRLPVNNTIDISTNDFSGTDIKDIYKMISPYL